MAHLDKLTYKKSLFNIIEQYCSLTERDGILFCVPSSKSQEKIFQELGFDVSGIPAIQFGEAWEENERELWEWWPGGVYCGVTAGELYKYLFSCYEKRGE